VDLKAVVADRDANAMDKFTPTLSSSITYYPYYVPLKTFTTPRIATSNTAYKYCLIIPSTWHNMCIPHCEYDLYNYLHMRHDYWVYNRLSVYRNWLYDYSHTFNPHSNYPHFHCKPTTKQTPLHNSCITRKHIHNPAVKSPSPNNHIAIPKTTNHNNLQPIIPNYYQNVPPNHSYTTNTIIHYKHLFTFPHCFNAINTNYNINTTPLKSKTCTLITKYSTSTSMFIHTNKISAHNYNNIKSAYNYKSLPSNSLSTHACTIYTAATSPASHATFTSTITTITTATSTTTHIATPTIPVITPTPWQRPQRHKKSKGKILRVWISPPASLLSKHPKNSLHIAPHAPAPTYIPNYYNNPFPSCNNDNNMLLKLIPDHFPHIVHSSVLFAKCLRHRRIAHTNAISLTAYSICFILHYPHLMNTPPLSSLAPHHLSPTCCIDYPSNREGIG
jgi:hypothetical protein